MSWLYSRALEAGYSAANCSDGEPSVPSKSTPMPQAYWSHDKTTGHLSRSRYGMTFGHLTEDHGAALLTSFLVASRVRTSAQREAGKESVESAADYGQNLLGSLAKYDRNSHSWKTAQCLLQGDLESYLETWPRSGTMRNGVAYQQPNVERRINGTEFGSLPTPTVKGNYNRNGLSARSGDGLATWVKQYPTPIASAAHQGMTQPDGKRAQTLLGAARGQLWPTPCAMEPEKDIENLIARLGRTRKERGGGGAPNLGTMVKLFPTPKKRDSKGTSSKRGPDHPRHLHNLDSVVEMGIGQINGRLNPLWVEWLMGWPIGWTGLNALETGKYHEWRLQHSICYLTGSKEYKDETK